MDLTKLSYENETFINRYHIQGQVRSETRLCDVSSFIQPVDHRLDHEEDNRRAHKRNEPTAEQQKWQSVVSVCRAKRNKHISRLLLFHLVDI